MKWLYTIVLWLWASFMAPYYNWQISRLRHQIDSSDFGKAYQTIHLLASWYPSEPSILYFQIYTAFKAGLWTTVLQHTKQQPIDKLDRHSRAHIYLMAGIAAHTIGQKQTAIRYFKLSLQNDYLPAAQKNLEYLLRQLSPDTQTNTRNTASETPTPLLSDALLQAIQNNEQLQHRSQKSRHSTRNIHEW